MKSPRASKQQFGPPAALLTLSDPESLQRDLQDAQLAIARRAYELFEIRGGEQGRDWEDWFRAESELLRPVSVIISESEDRIMVCANVLGFDENELSVAVQPRRLSILGQKKMMATETEGGKVEYIDWYPDRILRVIDLATEVIPERAWVELQGGVVKFDLPKAAKHAVETGVEAA